MFELPWFTEWLRYAIAIGLIGMSAIWLFARNSDRLINPALTYNAIVYFLFGAFKIYVVFWTPRFTSAWSRAVLRGDISNLFLVAVISGAILLAFAVRQTHEQSNRNRRNALKKVDEEVENLSVRDS